MIHLRVVVVYGILQSMVDSDLVSMPPGFLPVNSVPPRFYLFLMTKIMR